MKFRSLSQIALTLFFTIFSVVAAADSVDDFIAKVTTVSYDCPDATYLPELESILASDSPTDKQRFELSVARTQFLACEGKYTEAQETLYELIESEDIDKDSYAYASAIYQIGFIYDARELPYRCDFYEQAQGLSSPEKHSDIFLSASLGLITYCRDDSEVGERLGMLFSILQSYSSSSNYAELATIHNTIGLLYGKLDQHALAAEQYLKAHEMGLNVYTGSNKLSILISAITSLLSSGQFDRAFEQIIEFEILNRDIATPLTNFFYRYLLTLYYLKSQDYDSLAIALPELKAAMSQVSNTLYLMLFDWFETELCLHNGDKQCVADYADKVNLDGGNVHKAFTINPDYLAFNLKLQIFLGGQDRIKRAFDLYYKLVNDNRQNNQYSASILGVANLYSRVYDLEAEVATVEQRNTRLVIAAVLLPLFIGAVLAIIMRRKYLASQSLDPTTQLLNSQTAISRISKIDSPDNGRANAIALFDLGNFRELNRAAGSTRGDYVLRQISQTLKKVTRGTDILGRFAPEQFILCLQNIEEQSAKAFFERVQAELDSTFDSDFNSEQISVRSSMSIFVTNEKLGNLKEILDEMLMSISVRARHQ